MQFTLDGRLRRSKVHENRDTSEQLTHTISCGPGRRADCESKMRDGTDRQLDRVVRQHDYDAVRRRTRSSGFGMAMAKNRLAA